MLTVVATMNMEKARAAASSWFTNAHDRWIVYVDNSVENRGVVASYELAYRENNYDVAAATDTRMTLVTSDIIAYIHDDVEIYEEDWIKRVNAEFRDHGVGLVGFGGAKAHGHPNLYKVPYQLQQLARFDYVSNMRDAEAHGRRNAGAEDVAVLDGFCLIVRRELLDRCGGWHPDLWPPHHNYDYMISAQARRYGYRIRMVGVDCRHRGGETATAPAYQEWAAKQMPGGDAKMHEEGHRLFYDRFRDVMPVRVR